MAQFNYTGLARIQWGAGKPDTIQFIDFAADTGTLQVWENDDTPDPEYRGPIGDHPAEHMHWPVYPAGLTT